MGILDSKKFAKEIEELFKNVLEELRKMNEELSKTREAIEQLDSTLKRKL